MVKRIYFSVDELARDAVVAAGLAQALKKHDIELVFGNRNYSGFLKDIAPFDAVIFHNVDMVKNIFGSFERLRMPTIILPTEGIGNYCKDAERFIMDFAGFSYLRGEDKRWAESVSAYCLWGNQQLQNMRELVPDLLEASHVVGHPRYDKRCLGKHTRDKDKIRVGLVTRFDRINLYDQRPLLGEIYKMRQSRGYYAFSTGDEGLDIEDILYTNIMDARVMMDMMDMINSLKGDSHEIYVRVHPRENRQAWLAMIKRWNLPVKLAQWDEPFVHFAHRMDYVVGPPSTTYYDCQVAGATAVNIDSIVAARHKHLVRFSDDNMDIVKDVLRPQSMDELMDIIKIKPPESVEINENIVELLDNEADYPRCANSLDRLAAVCATVVDREGQPKAKAKDFWSYKLKTKMFDLRPRLRAEQSSNFKLTPSRKKWISALVE